MVTSVINPAAAGELRLCLNQPKALCWIYKGGLKSLFYHLKTSSQATFSTYASVSMNSFLGLGSHGFT